MINIKQAFFGERSVTKVAGLFESDGGARDAAAGLLDSSSLTTWQVSVLGPADGEASHDDLLGRALLPEQEGIWRTLIRAHVTMGVLGLVAGTALYAILMAAGNGAMQGSPLLSLFALCAFGTTFGLILGGVLSLRPDQSRLVTLIRAGLRDGKWAVIAHPVDAAQTQQAVSALQGHSLRVLRSF